MKRRGRPGFFGFAGAGRQHRFPLEGRQQARTRWQARDQFVVQIRARSDPTFASLRWAGRRRAAETLFERARELFSGGARRHQDEGVSGLSGIEIARQLDEELTIAGKIGRAEQPDATRSDHLVAGGSMTVS